MTHLLRSGLMKTVVLIHFNSSITVQKNLRGMPTLIFYKTTSLSQQTYTHQPNDYIICDGFQCDAL
jgi:hypothetical protein